MVRVSSVGGEGFVASLGALAWYGLPNPGQFDLEGDI
jgi:hypothetical protein